MKWLNETKSEIYESKLGVIISTSADLWNYKVHFTSDLPILFHSLWFSVTCKLPFVYSLASIRKRSGLKLILKWHNVHSKDNVPIGPSFASRGGWSMMCLNIGNTNAKVLPLPVLAMPIRSRPTKYFTEHLLTRLK